MGNNSASAAPTKGFINRFKNAISYGSASELISNYGLMAYSYFLLINENDKRNVVLIPISVVLQLLAGMFGPDSLALNGVSVLYCMNLGFLIHKYQRLGTGTGATAEAYKKNAFNLGLSTLLFLVMLAYISDPSGSFGNLIVTLIKNFVFVGLGAAFALINEADIKLPGQ